MSTGACFSTPTRVRRTSGSCAPCARRNSARATLPTCEVVDCRFAPYPVDIGWGGRDPILSLRRFGYPMLRASHLPQLRVMRAKHYLQEDRPDVVAALIACTARRAHDRSLEEHR